jgi:NADPH:quinone reductase-like Zn-dependent oxidoreductase
MVSDMDIPQPADNQVLIKVKAASVNPLDFKIRQGSIRWLFRNRFPLVLGNDISGTIIKVGKHVEGFREGDDVFCMMDAADELLCHGFAKTGAYAEYAITRADTLAHKPFSLSHQQAASVPLAALTVYQVLTQQANLKAGQKILINGASGGVGCFAIQIAKALGAEVTAVCSAKNQALVSSLGADHIIDYHISDFCENNTQYDVIYDVVANRSFMSCRAVLKEEGVYVSNLPTVAGFVVPVFKPLLQKLGMKTSAAHAWVKPIGKDLQAISSMIINNQLKTTIHKVFPLAKAKLAHDLLESRNSYGKVVLSVD